MDYSLVEGKILELCGRYNVIEVLYDTWCAPMLVGGLLDRGVACTPVRQDSRFLNAAVRALQRIVDEEQLRHDGNPILRWCALNACLKANGRGEVRLIKRGSRDRIDLAVASLFGLSGYFREMR